MWVPINNPDDKDIKNNELIRRKLGAKHVYFDHLDQETMIIDGKEVEVIPKKGEFKWGVFTSGYNPCDDKPIWVSFWSPFLRMAYEKTWESVMWARLDPSNEDVALLATYNEIITRYNSKTREEIREDKEYLENFWLENADVIVHIDAYISEPQIKGTGVCVQHALTAAGILERFKNRNGLEGKIYVKQNYVTNEKDSERAGGHAWCQYTKKNGEEIIIDGSLKYFGPLEQGLKEWPYDKPNQHVIIN
ncbi:hypothetical protein GF352_03285 [archaeon]|nr:hypothetical protein [archaeon]